jgi:hypothetical protein
MTIPSGILAPTTRPEPSPAPEVPGAEQGGEPADVPRDLAPEPKAPRVRRKKAAAATAAGDKEGRRLYLSESVHFRLRMLAYQRGQKLSEVAEDVLDKALPKWDVNRVG